MFAIILIFANKTFVDMTARIEKNIGESKLQSNQKKKLVFIIADKAVTERKIAEGAVTNSKIENGAVSRSKLSPDMIEKIDSLTDDVREAIEATYAATEGAEKVNATLSGTIVTITDRDGVSISTNIGFEIYRTYTSVAAMNADVANVPEGKFVIIATTDPLSTDNAKLYCKNNQGGFSFVSDLDQASSEAWADWLNNCKPQIEQAVARVDSMEIGMVEATGEVYVEYEETSNS